MNIAGLFEIKKTYSGEIWTNIYNNEWKMFTDPVINERLLWLLKYARSKNCDQNILTADALQVQAFVKQTVEDWRHDCGLPADFTGTVEEFVEQMVQKLIDFFSEFAFEPNFRFINTFAHQCKANNGIAYVSCYFRLIDSSYVNEIEHKMQSKEFKDIIDRFRNLKFTKVVNTRFKLYYGSQGTGKTTEAEKEANGNIMVCHSAMLPSDLMEDFQFIDGQPHFTPSALQDAIVNGKKIVLDEINLLPFESLRFLQSILDGKKEFIYKGKTIHIHENFQIIGTMNLVVNGCVYSLPEPLVDRSSELKEFKLTADKLIGAII